MKAQALFAFVAWAMVASPQWANACSVCMGDPNSNSAKGANAAIFLMLGVLAGMFGLLGSFAFYLYRRSQLPTPPHAELGETIEVQPEGGLN